MTGMFFRMDELIHTYSMPELNMDTLVAANVPVTMRDASRITIGQHEFPLNYGSVLVVALNNVVIPSIQPFAFSLADLLNHYVDCDAVGAAMADHASFGSPGLYAGACEIGIAAGAGFAEDRIRSLDTQPMVLRVSGDGRPMDTNNDSRVDVLTNGRWGGAVVYGTSATPLDVANFHGDRM